MRARDFGRHFISLRFVRAITMSTDNRKIAVKSLVAWLWRNSKGARGQAVANSFIGFTDVLCQMLWVLAGKHAFDIASGVKEGSLTVTGTIIASLMLTEIV